eukprot:scaffold248393_cov85-Cyclotella_meneghiniana.AAC.6
MAMITVNDDQQQATYACRPSPWCSLSLNTTKRRWKREAFQFFFLQFTHNIVLLCAVCGPARHGH